MTTRSLLLPIAFLLAVPTAFAQKRIYGMVNAEKQFAAFTVAHTIREGFLKYMDSAGLVFRQGNELNALDTYSKQKAGPGKLSWEPAFAVLSASGELGVSTGPYEFRPAATDTVTGRGSFSSIWRLDHTGEWKNLADLGTAYRSPTPRVDKVEEISLSVGKSPAIGFDEILVIDKQLNAAIQNNTPAAIAKYFPEDGWLNIDGQLPARGQKEIVSALSKVPAGVVFNGKAGNLSVARDLAYVYGTVINGSVKENYLRVWIYRNNGWQVILQTIKW